MKNEKAGGMYYNNSKSAYSVLSYLSMTRLFPFIGDLKMQKQMQR